MRFDIRKEILLPSLEYRWVKKCGSVKDKNRLNTETPVTIQKTCEWLSLKKMASLFATARDTDDF